MELIQEKVAFLRYDLLKKLEAIDPSTQPLWGKMNVHQMIEHLSYSLREASGKTISKLETAEEHVPKMQAFLNSDKPFRENTPNKLLPDTPPSPKHASIKDSLDELQQELNHFFAVYENEPGKKITNPFFGDLDYDMQVKLLYKHVLHHLRQFRVVA